VVDIKPMTGINYWKTNLSFIWPKACLRWWTISFV